MPRVIWDLRTGQQIGEPLTGRIGSIKAVACAVVDGVPVAVSGGDEVVRVWDLRTRVSAALHGLTNSSTIAITPIGDLVVGYNGDLAIFRRKAESLQ